MYSSGNKSRLFARHLEGLGVADVAILVMSSYHTLWTFCLPCGVCSVVEHAERKLCSPGVTRVLATIWKRSGGVDLATLGHAAGTLRARIRANRWMLLARF